MKLIYAIAFLLILSGCNTMQGIGRDIRGAGNAIDGAAGDTKKNM